MEWNEYIWYVLAAAGGIFLGYLVGSRRARRVKKRVRQQLNSQSLDLLDARSQVLQLQDEVSEIPRKDRLIQLALSELKVAEENVAELQRTQAKQEKRHFLELSRMRLHAVEARDMARKAADIAKTATLHLRRIEEASPVTQTIEAPEPKSYGTGDPVTVSVVDQGRLDGSAEAIAQVSNRDSARLTRLHSSNEAKVG